MWKHYWPQNLINVPTSCQPYLTSSTKLVVHNDHLCCSTNMDSTPDHYAHCSPPVHLSHACLCIALTTSAVDMYSPIIGIDTESRFISEKHLGPLLTCPPSMPLGPDQPLMSVMSTRDRASVCTSCSNPCIPQFSSHSVSTDLRLISSWGHPGSCSSRIKSVT